MKLCAALVFVFALRAAAADVSGELDPIRERHSLPALAAASISRGEILDAGACGLRRADGTARVKLDDKWHLGSITKSMTSSLAAMLVERGTLKWETTLADVFPKMEMDAAWRSVRLDQLLAHRAGAPHVMPLPLMLRGRANEGPLPAQRLEFARSLLQNAPDPAPGTKFVYSNQGYVIAGAMIERTTAKQWEELMREMIFKPLKLDSAGFGAPGSAEKMDQPWGHLRAEKHNGPVTPGPMADNPPVIGPAGTVHMSIRDFARYAGWHADEGRRDGKLLGADSLRKLHTAVEGQEYALGWDVLKRPWAGGRVLTHNGSNTMNFAVIWVAPELDFAVAAATNVFGADAEKGCDEAVGALIQKWKASRK